MQVTLCLSLLNFKSYQNEIWSNTNVLYDKISNMFLAECWGLETSSRFFYDFNKMTAARPFLMVDIYHY